MSVAEATFAATTVTSATVDMTAVRGFSAPPQAPTAQQVGEAWGDWIDFRELRNLDPDEPFRSVSPFTVDRRGDRARGEDASIFRTEHDLAEIRSVGNFFASKSAGGVGPLAALSNYTFGQGFSFTAQAAEFVGEVSEDLIETVQRVINGFVERNRFHGVADREADNRARRHGEALLVLEPTVGGQADLRFAEPSQLTEPSAPRAIENWLAGSGRVDCESFASSWSFGVHTQDCRFDKPFGYHFLWNETGTDWDYLTVDRVQHIKRNVDSCVKRGVSDFLAAQEFLLHSEKLLRNTAVGSAIQAAIAYIVQHASGVTRDGVESQRSEKATRVTNVPTAGGGQRPVYRRPFLPGTVQEISAGKQYLPGPLGSERAPRFIEVIQAALRYVGTRWSMPEYMISGDASNANLASSLVAEAPFVKAREADQLFYSIHFRDLLWKVLKIAFQAGRFHGMVESFSQLQELIFLKIDPPSVASRDPLKEAQTNKVYVDAGAMSVSTMAQKAGLDYQAEVDAGAKAAAPFGFGGAIGGPPKVDENGNPLPPDANANADANANGNPTPPQADSSEPKDDPAATESVDDAIRATCATFRGYP